MNSWKEHLLAIRSRKGKGHRVNVIFPRFELEHGKPPVDVLRKLVPNVVGKPKSLIKTMKVLNARHKRGIEISNIMYFKLRLLHDRAAHSAHRARNCDLSWKSLIQIAEELRITF